MPREYDKIYFIREGRVLGPMTVLNVAADGYLWASDNSAYLWVKPDSVISEQEALLMRAISPEEGV